MGDHTWWERFTNRWLFWWPTVALYNLAAANDLLDDACGQIECLQLALEMAAGSIECTSDCDKRDALEKADKYQEVDETCCACLTEKIVERARQQLESSD